FIVAGAGVPVAKHGNRAASSRAGSIDVLEALGVVVDLPVDASAAILREVGIAPFFAARAHPAMRHVAAVRRALGRRTVMNCMGRLLTPLGVRHQLVGVYARALVDPLAGALAALGVCRALVVHGRDGLDEITTADLTDAAWLEGGRVRLLAIDPGELGIAPPPAGSLAGGDARPNAEMLGAVLGGERGPRRDIALLNAGAALWIADAAADLAHGMQLAARSLDDGAARRKLEALVEASHRAVRAA